MKRLCIILSLLCTTLSLLGNPFNHDTVEISAINLQYMQQDYGTPKVNLSISGNPLRIAGKEFKKGLGTHAGSKLTLALNGNALSFHAFVGIDDAIWPDLGSAEFIVTANGFILWRSGIMKRGMEAKECIVDLEGKVSCELLVFDAEDNIFSDHANWADAHFIMNKGQIPLPYIRKPDTMPILTPAESPAPKIHGRHIYGAKPGKEILYYIPISGYQPFTISIDPLPKGLSFNPDSRIISGRLMNRGKYPISITVHNQFGSDKRIVDFIIGDTISYSPIMGWSSWYTYWEYVKQSDIVQEVKQLINNRLHDYGFEYIMIDDGWQSRDHELSSKGLIPSTDFPDMKSLSDSIHALGLKFGLYSSPGKETCVLLPGSYSHERNDAQYFCSIGVDFVKYDWCLYQKIYDSLMKLPGANALHESKKPYALFSEYLQQCSDRDIFYAVCQYGNNDVWKWARSIGGNSWRTTTDIQDNWWSVSNIVGFSQKNLEQYSGYNGWNDMDFLRIGYSLPNRYRRKTELTPNEQYTHVSLWALLNSPLILSCSLDSLDDFTRGLIKNGEVLAINQDKRGMQGKRIFKNIWQEVWAKPLDSGHIAIGFFNRDDVSSQTMSITWEQLGINNSMQEYEVRDVWRQKTIGTAKGIISTEVPDHGVDLYILKPVSQTSVNSEHQITSLTISIAPNPVSDKVLGTINTDIPGKVSIDVLGINGELLCNIYKEYVTAGQTSFSCKIPDEIGSGVYGLQVKQGFSCIIEPIVVIH